MYESKSFLTIGRQQNFQKNESRSKFPRSKRIKVPNFLSGRTEDLQYHLIRYFKKEPDNILIYIVSNDSPYKNEDCLYKELVNVKETIKKIHPNYKDIVISSPIVRGD